MKVVCANDTYKGHDQMYQIVDDIGALAWHDRAVVIPLDEWRSKQLNKLI